MADRIVLRGFISEETDAGLEIDPSTGTVYLDGVATGGSVDFANLPQLTVAAPHGITVSDGSFQVYQGGQQKISTDADAVFLQGGTLAIVPADEEGLVVQVLLWTGVSLVVLGGPFSEDPVFKVDADGTVHIKTGTTIQADL